jgi:hypothetical protein
MIDPIATDPPTVTLKGNCGVQEAIAQNPLPLREGGAYHLVDVLGSIGSEEEQLSSVGFFLACPFEQKLA